MKLFLLILLFKIYMLKYVILSEITNKFENLINVYFNLKSSNY